MSCDKTTDTTKMMQCLYKAEAIHVPDEISYVSDAMSYVFDAMYYVADEMPSSS